MTEHDHVTLESLRSDLADLDHKPVNEHVEFYESAYGSLMNQFTASDR